MEDYLRGGDVGGGVGLESSLEVFWVVQLELLSELQTGSTLGVLQLEVESVFSVSGNCRQCASWGGWAVRI